MEGFEGTFRNSHQYQNHPNSFENGKGGPDVLSVAEPEEEARPLYNTALPAAEFKSFNYGSTGRSYASLWKNSSVFVTDSANSRLDYDNFFQGYGIQQPAGELTAKAGEVFLGGVFKYHDF